ncbi:1-acyl-sn-glycerol-3-phosphate acyltransferase [Phycicoccus sp. BSK3Z-2]|uniref:1-acyl-sn-glycerol-3-phosphate acyltransferase n=1 Tax=Phycicoccus avicenniae TaxID=2828860 RepID=A0A941D6X2_9MICO|nr:lysophospholipid acyltransferase family protein [Phycicoccus avicenniae]MBR7742828.1 1-acyl-sn-glycerol-3-phosphate acyltransferase [Phycicoccus avicenniae]
MDPLYRTVVGAARTLFFVQGTRFTLEGRENVPRTGGAVMAINHTSYLDFMYGGLPPRKHGRYVRFMAKKSIFGHPVAGPLMRGMKHIPVDRASGGQAFREALTALRAGEIVGVFPEATMSRSFELKEFKPGAVKLAQAAGVPILPTTIWGGHRVWTKELPKQRGRANIPVLVAVGEPITVERREDVTAATARVRAAMQALLDRQQAAYPALSGEDLRWVPARLGGTAPTPEEAHERDAADMRRTRDEFTG